MKMTSKSIFCELFRITFKKKKTKWYPIWHALNTTLQAWQHNNISVKTLFGIIFHRICFLFAKNNCHESCFFVKVC